jgi:hypothetical protein
MTLLVENERLRGIVEEQAKTIRLLQEKIRYLLNQRFGPKSERLDDRQQSLFETEAPPEAPEVAEEIRVPEHTRRKGGRRRSPKHLPRERIEHDLPEDEKRCTCGACLTRIGEETSERYDVVPAEAPHRGTRPVRLRLSGLRRGSGSGRLPAYGRDDRPGPVGARADGRAEIVALVVFAA